MIDSIQLFPNFDEDTKVQSVKENSGTPLANELKKDVSVFSLGELSKSAENSIDDLLPNPMAMMQDSNSELIDPELQEALNSEELKEQIHNLKGHLGGFRSTLEDSKTSAALEEEHFQAVGVIIDLINNDLDTIAEHTQQHMKKQDQEQESVTRKVIDWISSGEEVLNRALLYFSDKNGERENLANFLKVQYAVQRATQRAELFASIVGTSVSSIKTIMTTQLG
ncbi:hypothetical protein [Candidatus Chlamydia sanziniae]|uniref:Type III secretion protein n=1 Tax=Candidatus Chlamydia sanziniae TaxID=1806891 RepID=A0A1A9HWV5_9CHLA|nr:hypothetical protein [Candidatus Chlamydia sanziniae]ANH78514.1 Type III secretion protein [Candidatus Chlamydia sanziniae]